jgi:hypothetical protein
MFELRLFICNVPASSVHVCIPQENKLMGHWKEYYVFIFKFLIQNGGETKQVM